MTTNETFFFRDKIPFDHFKTFIMPSLLATRARHKRIRIWCAAASTGQEPYSFAIALKEMGRQIEDFRIEIVATDISLEVLEKARSGIYNQFEVQRGLPIQMLIKYFTQSGETWQLCAGNPRDGAIPSAQPARRFLQDRHFRSGGLPQRADLFRPGDQERRDRPARARDGAGRPSRFLAPPKPPSGSPAPSGRSPIAAGFTRRSIVRPSMRTAQRPDFRSRARPSRRGIDLSRRRAERRSLTSLDPIGASGAFSSEVDTGSREENASRQWAGASVLIQSEPERLQRII